jgi:RHS repeat-associated protein
MRVAITIAEKRKTEGGSKILGLRVLTLCNLLLLLFSTILFGLKSQAQTGGKSQPDTAPGAPAGSYNLSGFESVNLFGGNLNFSLPLLNASGRGEAQIPINLTINSAHWSVNREGATYGATAERYAGRMHTLESPTEIVYVIDEDDLGHPYVSHTHVFDGTVITIDGTRLDSTNNAFVEAYYNLNPYGFQRTSAGYGPGVLDGRYVVRRSVTNPAMITSKLTRLIFTTPDGTEYELRDVLTGGKPWTISAPIRSRGTIFASMDGSSITFISDSAIADGDLSLGLSQADDYDSDLERFSPSGYLLFPNGNRFRIEKGLVKWSRDRNGNLMSYDYDARGRVKTIVDSLNRQVMIDYDLPEVQTPDTEDVYDQIKFKRTAESDRTIKVRRAKLSAALLRGEVETIGNLWKQYEQNPTLEERDKKYNPMVVTSVELPDSRRYELKYTPYNEIAKIVLPTGGAIEYEYGFVTSAIKALRPVTKRKVYVNSADAQPESTQSFDTEISPLSASTPETVVTVETRRGSGEENTPVLAKTKHYFHGRVNSFQRGFYTSWGEGKEFKTENYDLVSDRIMTRKDSIWRQRQALSPQESWYTGPASIAPQLDPRIVETRVTLENNKVYKRTSIDPSDPTGGRVGFDRYNNQTDVWEYDYGDGEPGALLRYIHTDYLKTNPVNGFDYAATNSTLDGVYLRYLPERKSVYDAAGVEVARTTYEYDKYGGDANHAALIPRGGITGLCLSLSTDGNCSTPSSSAYQTRGNVTSTTQYLLAGNSVTGSISSFQQYDVAGNVVKSIDPLSRVTEIIYDDAFADDLDRKTFAFPTRTISPIPDLDGDRATNAPLVTSLKYDFWSGKPVEYKDANGFVTTYMYEDPLNRLTRVTGPDNGSTNYSYARSMNAGVMNEYVRTRTSLDSTRSLDSYVFFDGLGRSVRSFEYDGGSPGIFITTDTQYDALGRVSKVSNPYRTNGSSDAVNPSRRWTETKYDALGRAIEVITTADGAAVKTDYSGNLVLVTDQDRKQRISRTDALGRLTDVWEIKSTDSATEAVTFPGRPEVAYGYRTVYTYDVLGNLLKVAQGDQKRYFAYDSLRRLVRIKQPEQNSNDKLALPDGLRSPLSDNNNQWSEAYEYDAAGNLKVRTDARDVVTKHDYDNLNRPTWTTYSDGTPTVGRAYDRAQNGLGRFWSNYTAGEGGSNSTVNSYDEMGRVKSRTQGFNVAGGIWKTFTTTRNYNMLGNVTSQIYPSGRTVTYHYDAAGRVVKFQGNLGDRTNRTYASHINYDEAGRMREERFDTQTPLYNKLHYNARGQLWDVRLSTKSLQENEWDWNRGALTNYYSANYEWGGTPGSSGSGPDNNGNVRRSETFVPLNEQLSAFSAHRSTYSYDALNRLSSVEESHFSDWTNAPTPQLAQAYLYDRFGNRQINAAATTDTLNEKQFLINPATNRIGVPTNQGGTMTYDNAGNLTADTYSGNALNRKYDAEGRMFEEWNNYSSFSYRYSYDADGKRVRRDIEGNITWQVYGLDGELLAEYAAGAEPFAPQKEYGYRGGELLIVADAPRSNTNTTRTNVALASAGARATASSSYPGGNFPAGAINNGERKGEGWGSGTGGWNDATAYAFLDWVQIDFSGEKIIDEIDVYTIPDTVTATESTEATTFSLFGVTAFEVQYLSGTTWVTVPGGSVSGNDKVWRKFTFTPVTARSIRILVHAAKDGMHSRIVEVEAYQGGQYSSPTVNNASFESPAVGTGFQYGATGGAWTFAGAAGVSGNNSAFTAYNPPAPVGTQVGFIQTTGTISQSVTLKANTQYTLKFTAAQRSNNTSSQDFEVFLDNTSLGTFRPSGASYAQLTTAAFTTSPGTHMLKFVGKNTNSGDNTAFIDDVKITGVNQASTIPVDVRWLVKDHLGTPRITADLTGSLAGIRRHDFLPFGEELYAGMGGRTTQQGYAGDNVRQQFTGYERDNETGLDFAQARYYSSVMGRFTGVDPLLASGSPVNPKTWNRYAYVLNNPLKLVDPTGLFAQGKVQEKKVEEKKINIFYPDPTLDMETPLPPCGAGGDQKVELIPVKDTWQNLFWDDTNGNRTYYNNPAQLNIATEYYREKIVEHGNDRATYWTYLDALGAGAGPIFYHLGSEIQLLFSAGTSSNPATAVAGGAVGAASNGNEFQARGATGFSKLIMETRFEEAGIPKDRVKGIMNYIDKAAYERANKIVEDRIGGYRVTHAVPLLTRYTR